MTVIFMLIPLSILIALVFLATFIWAVRSGQYEDTCTPSMRVLTEEAAEKAAPTEKTKPGGPVPHPTDPL